MSLLLVAPLKADSQQPVGKPAAGGSFIEWQVKVTGHESIRVTIATPSGELIERDFAGGRNPSLRLSDLPTAADGQYTYQLLVVPRVTADVKQRLKAARAEEDDAKVKKILRDSGLRVPVTQSGTFTVLNGAIVNPDATEPGVIAPAANSTEKSASTSGSTPVHAMDQVIPDDLIVQGSLCTGLDCVDNESFGFDTFRLKENNTRIHFDDTSTSTGFPNADWRIVANDSASGGANKLTIEDSVNARYPFTIESGAPADALYVDSSGNIGISTPTPGLDLHVRTTDTPAFRMEQTNAGGFTAQTWDIGANEANFFVRDLTGGSRLPFRIRPGAPTSSIDISATGNVGIGTASPAAGLHIIDDAANASVIRVQNTNAAGFSGEAYYDHTGSMRMLIAANNATGYAGIGAIGTAPLIFSTGIAERVRIDTAGNVGVGTSAPASKLHVNGGDIRVSGGSFIDDGTTLNVPDYVFEDSYRLMPLGELAKFVREEKHLPNVPAAAEVKKSGVDLSAFQMRLLEKVEELTLYTLSQHEQIGTLKAQNDELRERLLALEQKLQVQ